MTYSYPFSRPPPPLLILTKKSIQSTSWVVVIMSFWRIERALLLAIISAKKSDRPTTQNLFQTYFLLVASVSKYFSHALACIRWFQYIFWLNGDLNNESYILQLLKVLNIKASHNLSLLPFFVQDWIMNDMQQMFGDLCSLAKSLKFAKQLLSLFAPKCL